MKARKRSARFGLPYWFRDFGLRQRSLHRMALQASTYDWTPCPYTCDGKLR